MSKFVKVVSAEITRTTLRLSSLMGGPYEVEYWPGAWIRPILPGSRLFAFRNLQAAIGYYGMVIPTEFPYYGKMFWFCQIIDPRFMQVIKSPTEFLMRKFWMLWANGWRPERDFENQIPWMYKYKEDIGAVTGTALQLTNPVFPEDMERYRGFDYSYLDR